MENRKPFRLQISTFWEHVDYFPAYLALWFQGQLSIAQLLSKKFSFLPNSSDFFTSNEHCVEMKPGCHADTPTGLLQIYTEYVRIELLKCIFMKIKSF